MAEEAAGVGWGIRGEKPAPVDAEQLRRQDGFALCAAATASRIFHRCSAFGIRSSGEHPTVSADLTIWRWVACPVPLSRLVCKVW